MSKTNENFLGYSMENKIFEADPSSILIVDDHHLMRRTLKEWLSDNFPLKKIFEAGSGEEALETIEKYQPNIVLMDIHLPGISGIEAVKKIKINFPNTRVIVLTVQEDKRYRSKADEAGADAYVIKRNMYSNLIPLIRSINGISPNVEINHLAG